MRRSSTIKRVRIGERGVVYEQWGSGPPLLLIHGLSGSSRWWRRNIPAFAPHFTVYAVDLTGFGKNRAWRPLSLRLAATTLSRFIDYTGDGPAAVIGHSMGGHIATYMAACHPASVDRLVLAAASGLIGGSLVRAAAHLPRVAFGTARGFTTTLVGDAARAGALNLFLAARELLSDNTRTLLGRITAPTMVISAQHDHLIPPEHGAQQHAAIRDSRYTLLPNAGHILMWDQAEAFNHLVLDFLLTPAEPRRPLPGLDNPVPAR
ncbi:MAG: alpha/beta hydrolase [Herpetosiphon sp.]